MRVSRENTNTSTHRCTATFVEPASLHAHAHLLLKPHPGLICLIPRMKCPRRGRLKGLLEDTVGIICLARGEGCRGRVLEGTAELYCRGARGDGCRRGLSKTSAEINCRGQQLGRLPRGSADGNYRSFLHNALRRGPKRIDRRADGRDCRWGLSGA